MDGTEKAFVIGAAVGFGAGSFLAAVSVAQYPWSGIVVYAAAVITCGVAAAAVSRWQKQDSHERS